MEKFTYQQIQLDKVTTADAFMLRYLSIDMERAGNGLTGVNPNEVQGTFYGTVEIVINTPPIDVSRVDLQLHCDIEQFDNSITTFSAYMTKNQAADATFGQKLVFQIPAGLNFTGLENSQPDIRLFLFIDGELTEIASNGDVLEVINSTMEAIFVETFNVGDQILTINKERLYIRSDREFIPLIAVAGAGFMDVTQTIYQGADYWILKSLWETAQQNIEVEIPPRFLQTGQLEYPVDMLGEPDAVLGLVKNW